ncbi:MAG TPA: hypothetical protein VGM37_17265 [Armatimonadota bacterium]|jgi:hypothetical protein
MRRSWAMPGRLLLFVTVALALSGAARAISGGMGGGFGGGGFGGGSGGRGGGNGGAPPSDAAMATAAACMVAIGGYGAVSLARGRSRCVNVVLAVRRKRHYLFEFEGIVGGTDFTMQGERRNAVDRLADLVSPEDVFAGFGTDRVVRGSAWDHCIDAQRLWKRQSEEIDLQPSLVNVSPLGPNPHPAEGPGEHGAALSGVCLLCITAAVPARAGTALGLTESADPLETLRGLKGLTPEALFVFYAPDAHETLAEEEALRLVGILQATPERK